MENDLPKFETSPHSNSIQKLIWEIFFLPDHRIEFKLSPSISIFQQKELNHNFKLLLNFIHSHPVISQLVPQIILNNSYYVIGPLDSCTNLKLKQEKKVKSIQSQENWLLLFKEIHSISKRKHPPISLLSREIKLLIVEKYFKPILEISPESQLLNQFSRPEKILQLFKKHSIPTRTQKLLTIYLHSNEQLIFGEIDYFQNAKQPQLFQLEFLHWHFGPQEIDLANLLAFLIFTNQWDFIQQYLHTYRTKSPWSLPLLLQYTGVILFYYYLKSGPLVDDQKALLAINLMSGQVNSLKSIRVF